MSGPVSDYITRLEQQLRQRGIVDPRILAESREHLVDAIEEGRERGLSAADAEHEAFERFGAPEIVAAHILEERDRMKTGIAGAFATFWQRKWWILVPTVLAAVVTGVASDYFQPIRYQAHSTILVIPQRVPEDYVRPSVMTKIEDRLRSINQQVISRTRLERIIEDFNLYPERRKKDSMEDIVDDMSDAIDVEISTETCSAWPLRQTTPAPLSKWPSGWRRSISTNRSRAAPSRPSRRRTSSTRRSRKRPTNPGAGKIPGDAARGERRTPVVPGISDSI
jgi:hypothetical protein